MSRLIGTVLPFIGRVIAPCDEHGNPAMNEAEAISARFERGCICIAWLSFAAMIPFGEIHHRMLDPNTPRRYAPGDL